MKILATLAGILEITSTLLTDYHVSYEVDLFLGTTMTKFGMRDLLLQREN